MKKTIQSIAILFVLLGGMLGCKSDNNAPTAGVIDASANRTTAPGQTANSSSVIYSAWTTVPTWSGLTNSAGYVYYQYIFTGQTRIDAAALNQGAILVYVRFEGSTDVSAMPFRRAWDRTPSRLIYENWWYRAILGQLMVVIDPEANGYNPPTGAQVRYVIIPGDTPASGGRKAAIDYNDYEAVKQAFNIVD